MKSPKRYRKKPVVIEALKLDGDTSPEDVKNFCPAAVYVDNAVPHYLIHTWEGTMTAPIGKWIIKGAKGEFYPCDDEVFHLTYEEVDDHARA